MTDDLIKLKYSPAEDYVIVPPEVVQQAEAHPGHAQNLFRMFNLKVAKKYAKGSKVALRAWLDEHQIDYGGEPDATTIEVEAEVVEAETPASPAETTNDSPLVTCAITKKQFPRKSIPEHIAQDSDGRWISKEAQIEIWKERSEKIKKQGFQLSEDDPNRYEADEVDFTTDAIDLGLATEAEFRKFFGEIRAKVSVLKNPPAPDPEPEVEQTEETSSETSEPINLKEEHIALLKEKGFYAAGAHWRLKTNPDIAVKTDAIGTDRLALELEALLEPKEEAKKEPEKPQEKPAEKKEAPKKEKEPKAEKPAKTASKPQKAEKPKAEKKPTTTRKGKTTEPIVVAPEPVLQSNLEFLERLTNEIEVYKAGQFTLAKIRTILNDEGTPAKKLKAITEAMQSL